jgi:4-hydroxy-tetrahydrodipicolinate synthase
MNTDYIKGVIVPIITVIDEDEKIDEAGMRRQVEFVIKGGLHGILAFGSNGEFYQMEEDEMERGLEIMIDQAAGRVPVYFGIGAINTKKCVRLAKMAAAHNVAGISILQPMFLKPTEDELYTHFKTIADAVPDVPVLIYNNPGRTGYTLSGGLVEKLAHQVPNIVGMKDTSGDMTQTEEFIRRTRDIDFKVFGGKDTLLYVSLCCGAVGGVCTAGNFMPELITEVYNKFANRIKKAMPQLKETGKYTRIANKCLRNLPQAAATLASLAVGIFCGNKVSNYINEKVYNRKVDRNIRATDFAPHVDDLCMATSMMNNGSNFGDKIGRVIPLALLVPGYQTGIDQETKAELL